MIKKFAFFLYVILLVGITSCNDYQKVLKSSDYEYKYKKAREYYDAKEYGRAATLYQDLVNIYKGTSLAPEAYYYYAKSYYGQKDYFMAGHHFRTLLKDYPRSEFAPEAQFLVGKCFYLDSPKARLDQTNTERGIDALQLYINLYPDTPEAEEAEKMIDNMREKLVYKSYLSGTLYYDLQDYRAAVISLSNSLKDYPDTKYREELMFMLFKAKYLLAKASVQDKQEARLNDALDEYYTFSDEWKDSSYMREVNRYFADIKKMLNLKDEDLNID